MSIHRHSYEGCVKTVLLEFHCYLMSLHIPCTGRILYLYFNNFFYWCCDAKDRFLINIQVTASSNYQTMHTQEVSVSCKRRLWKIAVDDCTQPFPSSLLFFSSFLPLFLSFSLPSSLSPFLPPSLPSFSSIYFFFRKGKFLPEATSACMVVCWGSR